jgi:rare lipoprotein A
MELPQLVVELVGDYSKLLEDIKKARVEAIQQAKFLEKDLNLTIGVNDDSLKKLNQHFDLKVTHFKQTQTYFKNNPLKVYVDDKALVNLNKELDKLGKRTTEVNANTGVSPRYSETETSKQKTSKEIKQTVAPDRTTTIITVRDKSYDNRGNSKEIITSLKAVENAVRSQKPNFAMSGISAISKVLGGIIDRTIGGVLRGSVEGLGNQITGDLFKGVTDSIGKSIGSTIGSSNLLGNKIGEVIASVVGKNLSKTTFARSTKTIFNELLGEENILKESSSNRYVFTQENESKNLRSRDQLTLERRDALRAVDDSISRLRAINKDIRSNGSAYEKGVKLREALTSQAASEKDVQKLREIKSNISEINEIIKSLMMEEERLLASKEKAQKAVEASRKSAMQAKVDFDAIPQNIMPKSYIEAVNFVAGRRVSEKNIPKLVVDDASLKKIGAAGTYSVHSNAVTVTKELYEAINTGKLSFEQLEVLYHELQHAVDSNFGADFNSVQATARNEILTNPAVPTTKEREELQPFITMYSPEKQLMELNAELNARRNVAKKRDEIARQNKAQEYQQVFGSNGGKLNDLVNKQLDAAKKNLLDVVEFSKKNGIKLESNITEYISEIQSARENQHTIFSQLLKAQNLELNPEDLDKLDAAIEGQLNSIELLQDRLKITQLETIKRAKEIAEQAKSAEAARVNNINFAVNEAKKISSGFSAAYKTLKTNLRSGDTVGSNNQAQILVNNLARAKKDIKETRLDLGTDGVMGSRAGNQINQTLANITRLENAIRRLNATGKINIDLSVLDTERLGVDVVRGLDDGIEKSTPIVLAAVDEMTSKTNEATKKGFGIRSPSWIYKFFGLNIIQGLVQGIKSGSSQVITAIRGVFESANTRSEEESLKFDRINILPRISSGDLDSVRQDNELIEEIERHVRSFESSYTAVSNSLDDRFMKASASVNAFFEELASGNPQIDKVSEGFSKLFDIFSGLFTAMVGFSLYQNFLKPFIQSSIEVAANFENLERRIKFTSGSISEGAKNIAFLRSEAKRLNVDLSQTLESGSKFFQATKDTPIEGYQSRQIVSAVTQASAVYGLDLDKQQRVFTALEQMSGKTVVSQEELRQQLAEAIPNASQIAANAYGTTTQSMNQLLATSRVLAEDFLPKFTQQLKAQTSSGVGDAVNSSVAITNRFNNSLIELRESVGKVTLPFRNFSLSVFASVMDLMTKNVHLFRAAIAVILIKLGSPIWTMFITLLKEIAFSGSLVRSALLGIGQSIATLATQMFVLSMAMKAIDEIMMNFKDNSGAIGEQTRNVTQSINEQRKLLNPSSKVETDDFSVFRERFTLNPFDNDTKKLKKQMEDSAKQTTLGQQNTFDILKDSNSPAIQDAIQEIQAIDKALDGIKMKRRAVIANNPGDIQELRKLQEQEKELSQRREKPLELFGGTKGNLDKQVETLKTYLEYWENLKKNPKLYQSQIDEINKIIKVTKEDLATVTKEQDKMTKAIKNSLTEMQKFAIEIRSLEAKFNDLRQSRDTALNVEKTGLFDLTSSGIITPGQNEYTANLKTQANLIGKIGDNLKQIREMSAQLEINGLSEVLSTQGLTKNSGIDSLKAAEEKAIDGSKEKEILQGYIKVKEMQVQTIDMQTQLSEQKNNLTQSLYQQNKQIVEYYLNLNKQAQEITQVYKELVNTSNLNTAKNKIRSAVLGYQDNFITQFADSIIQILDTLNQPVVALLQGQREVDQAKFNLLNEKRQIQETQRSNLSPIMGSVGNRPAISPVNAGVTSEFGWRTLFKKKNFHNGIDYGVPIGTPVKAPTSGKVSNVFNDAGGGLTVTLSNINAAGQKVEQSFLHLSQSLVKVGDVVRQGQVIAKSGNSGSRTTGEHLDYRVKVDGKYINPRDFLGQNKESNVKTWEQPTRAGGNLEDFLGQNKEGNVKTVRYKLFSSEVKSASKGKNSSKEELYKLIRRDYEKELVKIISKNNNFEKIEEESYKAIETIASRYKSQLEKYQTKYNSRLTYNLTAGIRQKYYVEKFKPEQNPKPKPTQSPFNTKPFTSKPKPTQSPFNTKPFTSKPKPEMSGWDKFTNNVKKLGSLVPQLDIPRGLGFDMMGGFDTMGLPAGRPESFARKKRQTLADFKKVSEPAAKAKPVQNLPKPNPKTVTIPIPVPQAKINPSTTPLTSKPSLKPETYTFQKNPNPRPIPTTSKPQPTGNWMKTIASTYGEGKGEHGGKTSSGEVFNKNAMTAAMNETLKKQLGVKWGDKIEAVNTQNNKSVIVRITDHGPYEKRGGKLVPHSSRGLDLSTAAAKKINLSLGEVQFRVLGKNAQAQAQQPQEFVSPQLQQAERNLQNTIINAQTKINVEASQSYITATAQENKALMALDRARMENRRSPIGVFREIQDTGLNLSQQNPERELFSQKFQIERNGEDKLHQITMAKFDQENVKGANEKLLAKVRENTTLRPAFKAQAIKQLESVVAESKKIIDEYDEYLKLVPELTAAAIEKLNSEYLISEDLRKFSLNQQISQAQASGLRSKSRGNLQLNAQADLMDLNSKYAGEISGLDEEIRKESNPEIIKLKQEQKKLALIAALRDGSNIQRNLKIQERDLEFSQMEKLNSSNNAISSEVIKGKGLFGVRDKNLEKMQALSQIKMDFEREKMEIEKLGESGNYSSDYIEKLTNNLNKLNELKLDNVAKEFNMFTEAISGIKGDFDNILKGFIMNDSVSKNAGDLQGINKSLDDIAKKRRDIIMNTSGNIQEVRNAYQNPGNNERLKELDKAQRDLEKKKTELGKRSIGDAFSEIGKSILSNLASVASKELSNQLFGKLTEFIFGKKNETGAAVLNTAGANLNTSALMLQEAALALRTSSVGGSDSGGIGGLMGMGGGSFGILEGSSAPTFSSSGLFDFSDGFSLGGGLDFGSATLPSFAKGGMVGDLLNKERAMSGFNPRLIIANEGERVLTPKETKLWNQLNSSNELKSFSSGGMIGEGLGNINNVGRSGDTINVTPNVNINNSEGGNINKALFEKALEAKIQETIKQERRPGGSLNRGGLYDR